MSNANIAQMIADAAMQSGIDPNIAVEVGITESGLNQSARGAAGEIGVMQVEPATAPGADLTNLQTNITVGVGYLASLFGEFGDPHKAVAAYNAGPSRVQKAVQQGGDNWFSFIPASTRAYVTKIFSALGSSYQAQVALPSAAPPSPPPDPASADMAASIIGPSEEIQAAASQVDWSSPGALAVLAVGALLGFIILRDLIAEA